MAPCADRALALIKSACLIPCYILPASGGFAAEFVCVLSSEVVLSPILVRPVREQLEHDRVIRLLQAKYKRKFDVAINPGNEQSAPVGGPPPWYPDLVLQSSEKSRKLLGVVEVETTESVNQLEAMSQWATFSRFRVPFHLYVPVGSVDSARRLCADLQIPAAEVWAYHAVGDQMRFTLVHKSPQAGDGKAPARRSDERETPAPARRTAKTERPAARRVGEREGSRRPGATASTSARRKTVAPKAKAAPARRAAAKSARKTASHPSRTQKRR